MPYKDIEKQKACQARYYQENKDLYLQRNRIKRSKIRQFIIELKDNKPCMDCKINYPHYIMDFDRSDEIKLFELSDHRDKTLSLDKITKEIAKCDLVCANCHRHRTQMRRCFASMKLENKDGIIDI